MGGMAKNIGIVHLDKQFVDSFFSSAFSFDPLLEYRFNGKVMAVVGYEVDQVDILSYKKVYYTLTNYHHITITYIIDHFYHLILKFR